MDDRTPPSNSFAPVCIRTCAVMKHTKVSAFRKGDGSGEGKNDCLTRTKSWTVSRDCRRGALCESRPVPLQSRQHNKCSTHLERVDAVGHVCCPIGDTAASSVEQDVV